MGPSGVSFSLPTGGPRKGAYPGRHRGRPRCRDRKHPSTPEERAGTEPRPYRSARRAKQRAVKDAGPYAVHNRQCQAAGRCGHRPLRKGGGGTATALASGAERSVCASGWEERVGIAAEIILKVSIDLGRSLSRGLCTREPCPAGDGRTHRSAPTRSSECTATPGGAGQSPPPTGRLEPISGGGVWSPRPTEAMLAVRSSGPMQASAPTEERGIQRRFAPRNNSSPPPARSGASAPVPGKVQEGAESPFLVSASGGKKQDHFSRRHVRREKFLSRSDVWRRPRPNGAGPPLHPSAVQCPLRRCRRGHWPSCRPRAARGRGNLKGGRQSPLSALRLVSTPRAEGSPCAVPPGGSGPAWPPCPR